MLRLPPVIDQFATKVRLLTTHQQSDLSSSCRLMSVLYVRMCALIT